MSLIVSLIVSEEGGAFKETIFSGERLRDFSGVFFSSENILEHNITFFVSQNLQLSLIPEEKIISTRCRLGEVSLTRFFRSISFRPIEKETGGCVTMQNLTKVRL